MSPSFFKPKQTINRSSNDNLIGDLLVKAQIISRKQLDECVRLAGSKRLHLGQMLIMSGYITPRDLQAAVDAQSNLRDSGIEQDFAIRCLKIACKSDRTFAQVMNEQTAQQEEEDANTEWTLGHLLFEAEAVNKEQLDAAVQRSYATGIPMGRILVLNNAIDEMLLSKSLDLMVKLRDGAGEREEIVEALRTVFGAAQETPLTQNLLLPPTGKKVRIGELMVRAGVMGESDVLNAVELGLTYKVLIGQIMVEQGYVAPDIVEGALELQDYVERGQVNDEQAVETLSRILREGGTVQSILGSLQAEPQADGSVAPGGKIGFEKLLTLSRVVSSEQIDEAFSICRQTPEALGKILRLTGFIEQNVLQAVMRCHELMEGGTLNKDDALVALDYCLNRNTDGSKSLDDVLHELGWTGEAGAQPLSETTVESPAMDEPSGTPAQEQVQEEAEAGSESGGFNLLAHFGLSGEQKQAEEQGSPEGEDKSWADQEHSGEVSAQAESVEPIKQSPTESDSRLVGILDQMAEQDTTQHDAIDPENLPKEVASFPEEEPVAGNGQSPETSQVNLAAMLDREAGVSDSSDEVESVEEEAPKAEDLEPSTSHARPIVDRAKLKELEKTVAPSQLKMEELVLTQPEGQEEAESEKVEAVSEAMYRLAESYFAQSDFDEAQKTYEKILAIKQRQLGSQDPGLVDDLNKLAEVLWVQGNFRAAEPFVRRSVAILESAQPMDMLKLSESVRTLAGLYFQQGKYDPCLPLLEHALMMKRMELGEEHKEVGSTLREYAKLLKKLGRKAEAEEHYKQSKAILAKYK